MHDIEQTVFRIRNIIQSTPGLRVDMANLSDQDDLYDAGLKSLAMVHLMLALEDDFGVEFPDSVLHRGSFATVRRIADTVGALLDARRPLAGQALSSST